MPRLQAAVIMKIERVESQTRSRDTRGTASPYYTPLHVGCTWLTCWLWVVHQEDVSGRVDIRAKLLQELHRVHVVHVLVQPPQILDVVALCIPLVLLVRQIPRRYRLPMEVWVPVPVL